MKIEISVQEYFEELKLMEEQYGLEEDLYPWIYMLLQMAENRKKDIRREWYESVSMRDVHNLKKDGDVKSVTGVKKEILKVLSAKEGGAPDIAIFDKKTETFLGCIEIKAFKEKGFYKCLEISEKSGEHTWEGEIQKVYTCRCNFDNDKLREATLSEICNKYDKINVENVYQGGQGNKGKPMAKISCSESIMSEIKVQLKGAWKFEEKYREKSDIKLDKKHQIIKHLLRFKKVLYTNGLEFYLLNANKLEKKDSSTKMSIEVKELVNLSQVYENYAKNSWSEDALLMATTEWERLIEGLSAINWYADPKAPIQQETNNTSTEGN